MFLGSRQRKRPAWYESWPFQMVTQKSGGVSAQCFDALGAEVFAHPAVTFVDGDALDIGFEFPLGSHVRVADTVPKLGRFAATFAFSHCFYPQVLTPSGGDLQRKGDRSLVAVKSLPHPER